MAFAEAGSAPRALFAVGPFAALAAPVAFAPPRGVLRGPLAAELRAPLPPAVRDAPGKFKTCACFNNALNSKPHGDGTHRPDESRAVVKHPGSEHTAPPPCAMHRPLASKALLSQ